MLKKGNSPRSSRRSIEQRSVACQWFREKKGYPYFLQEWGKHAWEVADSSPITPADVENATSIVVAALGQDFFRVRFDRLTPLEKRYLRAMSKLGLGPHRSGDFAGLLGRNVSNLAPTRSQLSLKGMIWSPSHGDTAFTVPLFDQFMKCAMPSDDWKDPGNGKKRSILPLYFAGRTVNWDAFVTLICVLAL